MSVYRNDLSSISLFLLLDLLGTAGPNVPSYFPTTHWAYQNMARVESRLRNLRQLKSSPNYIGRQSTRPTVEKMWLSEGRKATNAGWLGGMIEDDHIPFMKKGVEVLHIIPNPFPWVWHRKEDDGPHLDIPTVQDWAQIVSGFSAEWMDLEGYMPISEPKKSTLLERSEGFLEENSWEEEKIVERDEL
jgi:glutaminyl-peptide cyclotransferase